MADKLALKAAEKEKKEEYKAAAKAAAAIPKATSAEASVKKRPACDLVSVKIPSKILKIPMQDVFKKLKKRRKEMTYGNFTNNASDNGYRRAKGEGAEYPVQRAFAKIQYDKAKDIWHNDS